MIDTRLVVLYGRKRSWGFVLLSGAALIVLAAAEKWTAVFPMVVYVFACRSAFYNGSPYWHKQIEARHAVRVSPETHE